jgi:uncharacterized protein involved in response to NO
LKPLISESLRDSDLLHRPVARLVPFACGLRPFFLLAGIDAVANIAAWLIGFFRPEVWPATAILPMYWHAHEMLFGFIAAAIAGFLLTAVPNWTGLRPYAGKSLIALASIWLAGRIALIPVLGVPEPLAATIDLLFFPALAVTLAPPLIRAHKVRNMMFLVLLSALFAANLTFHLGVHGLVPAGEHIGIGVAADIVCILIVILGGRIVPAFTKSGLARTNMPADIRPRTVVEYAAVGSIVAVLIADLTVPLSPVNGAVALAAGIVQAVRLSQWQGHRTLRDPLIWVLHLGYAWLAIGLMLKGIWFLFAATFAAKWVHALTIGAFATMILAVMTRASLGHTGRALVAPRPMAAAYLLVSLAAVVRVFGPAILPEQYFSIVGVAGALWIAAFALFLLVYAPILLQPRIDGRPG